MPRGMYSRPLRKPIVPVGPSIAYIPLTQGQFALVDRDAADFLGQWNWFAYFDKTTGGFYAARSVGRNRVPLHKAICVKDGFQTDHVNLNGLDNRRSNLRLATQSQNGANKGTYRSNQCGLKGASPAKGKWRSQIKLNGKVKHLGYFSSAEEAHHAYLSAARMLHGEFARAA